MPDLQPPSPDDDDALADALAAELEARALRDTNLRRVLLRRLKSMEPDQPYKAPCEMTLDELAELHATDRHSLNRIAARIIRRLKYDPRISHLKSSLKP